MPNTFAPDSVADRTILGVLISVKPSPSSVARNPATAAALISNGARSSGCRRLAGALSRMVGRLAVTVGRYRSNGGRAAGPDSGVITGRTSSAPPGAWSLAATVPVTDRTVSSANPAAAAISSGAARTTWARPDRSRMTRNVMDLSGRRRCSQPAIRIRSPACAGTPAAMTRTAGTREIIALLPGMPDPLGVRARRETRCATAPSPPPGWQAASAGPVTGANRRGMGQAAGRGRRSSPHSGGSSPQGASPPFQLPAALCVRVNSARVLLRYSSPSARYDPGYRHGRRPFMHALGVDIGGTGIKAAPVDVAA